MNAISSAYMWIPQEQRPLQHPADQDRRNRDLDDLCLKLDTFEVTAPGLTIEGQDVVQSLFQCYKKLNPGFRTEVPRGHDLLLTHVNLPLHLEIPGDHDLGPTHVNLPLHLNCRAHHPEQASTSNVYHDHVAIFGLAQLPWEPSSTRPGCEATAISSRPAAVCNELASGMYVLHYKYRPKTLKPKFSQSLNSLNPIWLVVFEFRSAGTCTG